MKQDVFAKHYAHDSKNEIYNNNNNNKIRILFAMSTYSFNELKFTSVRKKRKEKENNKQKHGVLRKLKHIFPNTYQRIKSIRSPAKGGTGCYRFNYQPGS